MYICTLILKIIAILIAFLILFYFVCQILIKYEPKHTEKSESSKSNSINNIYYASQTGSTEKLAYKLSNILKKSLKKDFVVTSLDNFEFDDLINIDFAIFLIATCGDGEVPDNSRFFHSWLEGQGNSALSNLNYILFGAGSNEYEQFNSAAKNFHNLLRNLGANSLIAPVYGDSEHDINPDFIKWIKGLLPILALYFGIDYYEPPDFSNKPYKSIDDIEEIKHEMVYLQSEISFNVDRYLLSLIGKAQLSCAKKKFLAMRCLGAGDCWHIEFERAFDYEAADNVGVLHRANDHLLGWWAQRLGIDNLDTLISFKPLDKSSNDSLYPFPIPCTLRDALSLYCELEGLPDRLTLLKFTCFLTDEDEVNCLARILNDTKLYNLLEKDVKMSLVELVDLFMSSAKFHLSAFLQLIPKKLIRYYTISSSPLENDSFSITVKRTAERLHPLKKFFTLLEKKKLIPKSLLPRLAEVKSRFREFKGACSNYLVELKAGDEVYMLHSASTLRIDLDVPMLMIATGTGIAPFRSFYQHLRFLQIYNKNSILVYGCRHEETHWLYKEEILSLIEGENKVISKLLLAFSRDQKEKIYVQDRMVEEEILILKHIFESEGRVYICGNREMGKSVKKFLTRILSKHHTVPDGGLYLDRLIRNKRVLYEVWD